MIAILEDDDSIRDLVIYTLNNTGHKAIGFTTPDEFWEYIRKGQIPSLLLLDIMLPGNDGLTVLKELRRSAQTEGLPVIMITAKDTEYDKVLGLDSGADDYIAKPFGMMELVSRVNAVLRRIGSTDAEENLVFEEITIDDKAHVVWAGEEKVDLTNKEYDLLKILIRNKGRVLTRNILLQNIWGYDFDGETRTVDVHIRTLRSKLGDSGIHVETVRGVGYRMGERQ